MRARCSRWAVPAILMAAAVALSACAANNLSATPNVQGFDQTPLFNVQSSVTCPKKYALCVTVSQKKGLAQSWCYGPAGFAGHPCKKTNAAKAKWSGVVCKAKTKTCTKPIKELTAAWSGPFKCKGNDGCKGTYEVDTFTPGPGLKVTKKYVYDQDIQACVGTKCQKLLIGINVGK